MYVCILRELLILGFLGVSMSSLLFALGDHYPLGVYIYIAEDLAGGLEERIEAGADDDTPELRPAAHLDDVTAPHRRVAPHVAAGYKREQAAPQQR